MCSAYKYSHCFNASPVYHLVNLDSNHWGSELWHDYCNSTFFKSLRCLLNKKDRELLLKIVILAVWRIQKVYKYTVHVALLGEEQSYLFFICGTLRMCHYGCNKFKTNYRQFVDKQTGSYEDEYQVGIQRCASAQSWACLPEAVMNGSFQVRAYGLLGFWLSQRIMHSENSWM